MIWNASCEGLQINCCLHMTLLHTGFILADDHEIICAVAWEHSQFKYAGLEIWFLSASLLPLWLYEQNIWIGNNDFILKHFQHLMEATQWLSNQKTSVCFTGLRLSLPGLCFGTKWFQNIHWLLSLGCDISSMVLSIKVRFLIAFASFFSPQQGFRVELR